MISKRKRITQLLAALGEGYQLYRICHETERENFFIEYFKDHASLRCHGWASALGLPIDRIESILDNPFEWHIGPLAAGLIRKEDDMPSLQDLGFENEKELADMISSVDLTSNDKVTKFKSWQNDDGTKQGLQVLLEEMK